MTEIDRSRTQDQRRVEHGAASTSQSYIHPKNSNKDQQKPERQAVRQVDRPQMNHNKNLPLQLRQSSDYHLGSENMGEIDKRVLGREAGWPFDLRL